MRKSILDGSQIMNFEFQIEPVEKKHFHQSIEIIYVLDGDPEIVIQDKKYQAHPEDIIVINANKEHSYQSREDVLIGYFEIDYRLLGDMLNSSHIFFWCNSILNKNAAYADMRRVMKQIFGQYFEKSGYGKVVLQGMYYQLLQMLLANFMVQNDDRRFDGEKSQDEERISAIVNYINSNYKKKIRLTELSEALYLSVPYLSKYIKKKMGMNFIDYTNNIRLFHAVDDLLYTSNSITSIALENGFANVAAFTELFKKTYSMTPSEYRQQMKEIPDQNSENSKKNRKKLLEKRVSAYLDNQLLQGKCEISSIENCIVLDTQERKRYKKYWKKMINVGRMEDLLRSDMREQILLFRRELGISYVRMWDIFSPNMMMNYSSDKKEYYFGRADSVIDFLIENDIRPYLEMGLKPRQIFRGLNDNIYKKKIRAPMDSVEKYESFLNAFLTHYINRYGLEEVEKWYFEQWCGEDFSQCSWDENFWRVFEIMYRVLKKHSSKIRVGGGGIGIQYGSTNLRRLISIWVEKNFKPDFISLYCYPYIRGDEEGTPYAHQSTDRDFLKNQLEMAGNIINESGFSDVEIHVTEWSSTISNRNNLNDSCYKGAYIIKNVIDCFGKVNVLGYWVGSDIFSEHIDSGKLLFGGCGLVSSKGIKKPAFYAYRFLSHLGEYLLFRGKNSLITTNGNNNYSIVCHNYKHLNYKYYLKMEKELEIDKLYQLFEDNQSGQLNYQFTNVKNGKYKIKTYSVSDESGNIQREWFRLGNGNAGPLSKVEIEYLKRITTPFIQIRTCQVTKNVLNFETKLRPQEIQYIHISYLYE